MSNIRNSHAHDMMNDNIQHFAVVFDYKASDLSREKEYIYKARKGQYQVGDLAVVLVKNDFDDSRGNSYKVVLITHELDLDEVNFQVNYDYSYIVSKIDLTEYEACVAAEKAFCREMNKLKTTNLRQQITKALVGNSDEKAVKALMKTIS